MGEPAVVSRRPGFVLSPKEYLVRMHRARPSLRSDGRDLEDGSGLGDMSIDEGLDKWAAWLLHRRDGDDPEQREKALEHLVPIRDRILDNARIRNGETLLDVGAGDGLIAFGAVERLGPNGRVIASDISADLVARTREIAQELGVAERMSFVQAPAEDLAPIGDSTVDVVTTRSVLIYVDDKARAFGEFFRVLRPGGRASLLEPINNYFPDTPDEYWGFDSRPVRDLVEKIWKYEGWVESEYVNDPMMNFNTKDLLRHAEAAGFAEIHIELLVDVEPGTWVVDWERLLNTSPNPNAHTAGEAIRAILSREEAERFERHIRPLADAGRGVKRSAFAYLVAVKGD
jgi:arsenite methyltransferase